VEVVADQAPGLGLGHHKLEAEGVRTRQTEGGIHAAAEVGYTAREGDRQLWVLTASVVEVVVVGAAAEEAVVAEEGPGQGEGQAHLWDQDRGGTLALDGYPALYLQQGVGHSSLQPS
jgi:hypothetical protein